MQIEWQRHRGQPYDLHPQVPFRVAPVLRSAQKMRRTRQVMGYLPYWEFKNITIHPDILSVLAYFGVSCNSDGSLNNPHHWAPDNQAFQSLLRTCHAHGVRVVLTVTNFKSSSISAILNSQTARANLVSNLVKMVADAGGDGVNVDFEGVSRTVKANLVAFMTELKHAMDKALPNAHVSLATPAVDWSGAFDYDVLAEALDGMFIMGYDYHWGSGDPGPVSPLAGGGIWGKYSLEWTVSDYFKYGGPQNRAKFILGLPLYAYDWACTGIAIPGQRVSGTKATPVIWSASQTEAQNSGGWQWDDASQTAYYTYTDKTDKNVHQVWGDNLQSMGLKLDMVNEKDLGGFGFWALGYGDDPGLWDAIRNAAFEPVAEADDGNPPDNAPDQAGDVAGVDDGGLPDQAGDVAGVDNERLPDQAEDVAGVDDGGLPDNAPVQAEGCNASGKSGNPTGLPVLILLTLGGIRLLRRRGC